MNTLCRWCGTADHCESYDEDCRSLRQENGYGYGDCDDERCTCDDRDASAAKEMT
ncbi:MAG: hypothetical protein OXG44_07380 [Gammaproteobacteria bacterium]|nr:hypothetical protein [Gammaproteobacteria bacterium]